MKSVNPPFPHKLLVKDRGASVAVHILKQVTTYYIELGSNVGFVDNEKAFDRIGHNGSLFMLLT